MRNTQSPNPKRKAAPRRARKPAAYTPVNSPDPWATEVEALELDFGSQPNWGADERFDREYFSISMED